MSAFNCGGDLIYHKLEGENLASVIASAKCRGQMFPIDTDVNGNWFQRDRAGTQDAFGHLGQRFGGTDAAVCTAHPHFPPRQNRSIEKALKSELLWLRMRRRAVCQKKTYLLFLTLSISVIKVVCSTCKLCLSWTWTAEKPGLRLHCTANAWLREATSSHTEINLYLSCHQNIMWAFSSKVLIFTFQGKSNKLQKGK